MNTDINISAFKLYLLPVIAFVFVVVASSTLGKSLYESIVNVRSEIEQEGLKNSELTAKRDFLAALDQSNLNTQTTAGISAIPGEESLLAVLSTLRTVAIQKGVNVLDFQIKSVGSPQSGLNSIGVVLNIQGSLAAVTSFIESIKDYAPRMIIVQESINNGDSLSSATIEIVSAWSPLPQAVGSTSSRLEALKASDLELIRTLGALSKIEGTSTVGTPLGRENPFSL